MFAGPIGVYFLTLNTIFGGMILGIFSTREWSLKYGQGNSTFAGATAAITANVVLIAYVVVAMKEDQSEKIMAEEKARKGQ